MKLKKLLFRSPKYIWYLFCVLFFDIVGVGAKIVGKKFRNVWIIAERGYDARDNSYHLYRYIRERHPEINAYYIIDPSSPDYPKIAPMGNIVNYGSFLHHLLFAVSTHKISTHICGYAPDILVYSRFVKLGLVRGKLIFLQHGITKDYMEWLCYSHTKLDLFVCGGKAEYLSVKEEYGYPGNVVQYLGFCRYDALLENREIKNQILLMPSWRGNFTEITRLEEFKKTGYYQELQALLLDKRLLDFLEKKDLNLIFYPHIEAQKFLQAFRSDSKRVIVASFKTYDVQELLLSSKLLITDFSSVFFDFAYMGKPMVFFQFDEVEYRKQNYKEGYFSYRKNGFGPVFSEKDRIVDYILEEDEKNYALDSCYMQRINAFFEYRDTDNCKRNFEMIRNL